MINIIASLFLLTLLSSATCKERKTNPQNCYRGRLAVKGMCMNYTIKVISGNIDTSLMQREWRDETTGKVHENVFRLSSLCSFPSRINEGEEFYFIIPPAPPVEKCSVCMAYYPTPEKSIFIKVVDAPCK